MLDRLTVERALGRLEYKWYAPGIGFIKSTMVQGGTDTSELVKVTGP